METKVKPSFLRLAGVVSTQALSLVTSRSCVKIFPTGRGHYALGSPDGFPLFPGDSLTVLVKGHEVTGVIQPSSQGDYLKFPDESCCGLCAGMRAVALPSEISLAERIKAAYADRSNEAELRFARLTKQAMETMSEEEWSALCAELESGVAQ